MLMMVAAHLQPNEWTVERSFAKIEAEWRAFEREAVGTPFQSADWLENLLLESDQARNAIFVLGRRDGAVCIAFALTLFGGKLRWLGERWSNYNMPLVAPALFAALDEHGVDTIWRDVRTSIGGVSASVLRHQPAIVDGLNNAFAAWASVREPVSAHARTLSGDWETLYATQFSSHSRKAFRNRQRRLESEGKVEFLRVLEPKALRQHVMTMLQWKSEQVDAAGRRNAFSATAGRTLFARFAENHPDKVRVYAIHFDGRPIAITFMFEAHDSLVVYQMAHSGGPTSRHSPGRLLVNYAMKSALADGYTLFDLSVGDDAYKGDLCNRTIAMASSIKAHTPAGLVSALGTRFRISAKSRIKSNPALFNAAKKINSRLKSVFGRKVAIEEQP